MQPGYLLNSCELFLPPPPQRNDPEVETLLSAEGLGIRPYIILGLGDIVFFHEAFGTFIRPGLKGMKMQLLNKCIEHSQEIPFSFTSCGIKARHSRALIVRVTFKWKWPPKLVLWYKM